MVLSVLFIMIGFSSWLMLPIRANANTTINENNPSSARELLAYYNREQYGDANVFYDKYYSYTFRKEEDPIKPYSLAEMTYQNNVIVHDSLGTFFEKVGVEKQFTLNQGLEWTGGDSIDDYC